MHAKTSTVFYNEAVGSWEAEYLRLNHSLDTYEHYTPYNTHLGVNIFSKFVYLALFAIVLLLSLPILVVRPVALWALGATVLHEHIKVMYQVNRQKPSRFYDFLSYEMGSSFLSSLLTRKGIKNYFITSPTPLYEVYPDCSCDVFLSTSPYHKDEIAFAKSDKNYPLNFHCNSMESWPYDQYTSGLQFNADLKDDQNQKNIGVYTSGVWWRRAEQHKEYAVGFFDSEDQMLSDIKAFVLKNPSYIPVLYLHPRERNSDTQLSKALVHYKKVFGKVEFKFGDFQRSTKAQFAHCNIAIAAGSNTIYERLYAGYKSLFAPYYQKQFPIKTSHLNSISARSYEDLETMILSFSQINTNDYFESNQLWDYHHSKLSNEQSA